MKRLLFLVAFCTAFVQMSHAAMQTPQPANGDFSTPVVPLVDTALFSTSSAWTICLPEKSKELVKIENCVDANPLMGNAIKMESFGEHALCDGYLVQWVDLRKARQYEVSMSVKVLKGEVAQVAAFFAPQPFAIDPMSPEFKMVAFDEVNIANDDDKDGWIEISERVSNPNVDYFGLWLSGANQSVLIDNVSIKPVKDKDKDKDAEIAVLPPEVRKKVPEPKGPETVYLLVQSDVPIHAFTSYEPGSELVREKHKIYDTGIVGYEVDAQIFTNSAHTGMYKTEDVDLRNIDKKSLYNGKTYFGDDYKWVLVRYEKGPEGKYKSYMGEFAMEICCYISDIEKVENPMIKLTVIAPEQSRVYNFPAEELVLTPTYTIENGKITDFPEDGAKVEGQEEIYELMKFLRAGKEERTKKKKK